MMKKFFLFFLIIIFWNVDCKAELIIDDSVHNQISQKYELDKLPDLPSNLSDEEDIFTPNEFDIEPSSKYIPDNRSKTPVKSGTETQADKQTQQNDTQKLTQPSEVNDSNKIYPEYKNTNNSYQTVRIPKGKVFKVVNNTALADTMKKGTIIKFTTTKAVTSKSLTIPKGTVFKGKIKDSHAPNLSANGGLLVIEIDTLVYKDRNYPIEAKITIANNKHIFFNNIKGKHKYWKNLVKSTAKGKKVYDTMWAKTKKHFKPNIEIIITPVTFITGSVVYAANIIASPVLAIFSKGGNLKIPQNSYFEIKMLEGVILYK